MAFNHEKWAKEKYIRYTLFFKKDEDADIIKVLEDNIKKRITATETVRKVMKGR